MRKGLKEAFDRLNLYLEGKEFLAGETVTIADIFAVCTISTVMVHKFFFLNFKLKHRHRYI